jgi:HD-GYP domain-containing protein (c-di-GMP phosphodiesterase class II)
VRQASRPETSGTQLRLAELLASLSLAVDLGFDQPMEHVLRQTLISLRLADRVGLHDQGRATLYYTSLLVNVACHADAHEQAKWFGDDIALKANKYRHDFRTVAGMLSGLRAIGSGNPPLHRLRVGVAFAFGGHREVDAMIERHAELACRLGERLGLDDSTRAAVSASYERWDGRGWPGLLRGEQIPIESRISQLAEYVEVAHRVGGPGAARQLAGERAGRQFDAALASIVGRDADTLFAGLDGSSWHAVVSAEPRLAGCLSDGAVDDALTAIADFVDLKSPYTLGHSAAVASLAAGTGRVLGLPADDVDLLLRAGLVHDVGRLGVSNAIWDKSGPLGTGEWERIRLYPYLTERILRQSETLARLGDVAVQHRERLDGSGYPRGLTAPSLSVVSRTLAVADAYRTWREPRPHRPELSESATATRLRSEAAAGRLDADIVDAVLIAAGHAVRRRHSSPAGLSPREIEVLRLIARGLSSNEIAKRLTLSAKTVRNHTEHIYAKTGADNRVAASLFAVEHGLLPVL